MQVSILFVRVSRLLKKQPRVLDMTALGTGITWHTWEVQWQAICGVSYQILQYSIRQLRGLLPPPRCSNQVDMQVL